MFKHFALAICIVVLTAVLLSACAIPGVTSGNMLVGSGRYATRDYAFTGFTGIQANGGFQVSLTGSDAFKVSITADENLFDAIDVRKDGSVLVIGFKPGAVRSNKLDVAVALPTLESIALNGGSGVSISGAAPKAASLRIDANGGSRVDVRNVAADRVSVTLNGGAQATVNAKTGLDYNLNGGSQLQYTGNPTIGSSKAEGGSQATKF